jgi:hypothetical protein
MRTVTLNRTDIEDISRRLHERFPNISKEEFEKYLRDIILSQKKVDFFQSDIDERK